MAWYNEKGEMQDVVISTRVRLARNLEEYPFTSRLSDKAADELIDKVCTALPEYSCERFFSADDIKCHSYMEMHCVSPEFAGSMRHRALLKGENDHVNIMVCEEDHLRIQSIVAGFDIERALEFACGADEKIGKALKIAFSEKYGYLTQCPTNLGSAMRISAMLCLPALTKTGNMERYIEAAGKMGVAVRGLYGEGSRAIGCLYQISNRGSLGISDEDTVKLVSEVVTKLAEAERGARKALHKRSGVRLVDKICRTVGVFKNACMLSSGEVSEGFAELKYGISLGIIENITDRRLSEMLIAVQPATLSMLSEGLEDENSRDIARASLVRDMMRDVNVKYN